MQRLRGRRLWMEGLALGGRALEADAMQASICAYLSVIALAVWR